MEGFRGHTSHYVCEKDIVKGAQYPWSAPWSLFLSEIIVGTATSDWGNLNAVGLIVSWGGGAEWQQLRAGGKVDIVSGVNSVVRQQWE